MAPAADALGNLATHSSDGPAAVVLSGKVHGMVWTSPLEEEKVIKTLETDDLELLLELMDHQEPNDQHGCCPSIPDISQVEGLSNPTFNQSERLSSSNQIHYDQSGVPSNTTELMDPFHTALVDKTLCTSHADQHTKDILSTFLAS